MLRPAIFDLCYNNTFPKTIIIDYDVYDISLNVTIFLSAKGRVPAMLRYISTIVSCLNIPSSDICFLVVLWIVRFSVVYQSQLISRSSKNSVVGYVSSRSGT